jgi:hypothetical protein
MTPSKLNNSLMFFRSISLSLFLFNHMEGGGRRWEIMWGNVGCTGATANFIAQRCNNRGGKAARLRMHDKKAQ